MSGTITIHRTYFRESEIHDGDYMGGPSTYTDTEVHDGLTAREAADLITREGLTFYDSWFSSADGSRELWHTPFGREGNDWRVEESAHVSVFPERVESALIDTVTSK